MFYVNSPSSSKQHSVQEGCQDSMAFYVRNSHILELEDSFRVSYMAAGEVQSPALVFLHSAFSAAFSWRKVIRQLSKYYYCLAPDWLGTGGSRHDKIPSAGEHKELYDFDLQQKLLDQIFEQLVGCEDVVLIVQGGGSVVGCDWAFKHRHRVKAIVHIGGVFGSPKYSSIFCADKIIGFYHELSQSLKSQPDALANTITKLAGNSLQEEELAVYMRLLSSSGDMDDPMNLLRLIPDPELDLNAYLANIVFTEWIQSSSVPKLMLDLSHPHPFLNLYREKALGFKSQTVEKINSHFFIQEQNPEVFVEVLTRWLEEL